MPSLKAIRTRISSVKSTQKITRAMKLVSAARLRRAQDAIVGARPYANALAEAIVEVALRAGADAHPLLDRRVPERLTHGAADVRPRPGRRVQRQRVPRPAALHRRAEAGDAAGARDRAGDRRQEGARLLPPPQGHHRPRAARADRGDRARRSRQEMAHIVTHSFQNGRTDAVYLVYNEFKSAITQRVVVEPLLPLTGANLRMPDAAAAAATDFLYEPSKERAARRAAADVRRVADLPRAARVDGLRARRAHDRDGQRDHATPRR